jgi:hypothetical protein
MSTPTGTRRWSTRSAGTSQASPLSAKRTRPRTGGSGGRVSSPPPCSCRMAVRPAIVQQIAWASLQPRSRRAAERFFIVRPGEWTTKLLRNEDHHDEEQSIWNTERAEAALRKCGAGLKAELGHAGDSPGIGWGRRGRRRGGSRGFVLAVISAFAVLAMAGGSVGFASPAWATTPKPRATAPR